MARRRVNFYIEEEQVRGLKALSDRTRIPQATFVREGLTDLLAKYHKENNSMPPGVARQGGARRGKARQGV